MCLHNGFGMGVLVDTIGRLTEREGGSLGCLGGTVLVCIDTIGC